MTRISVLSGALLALSAFVPVSAQPRLYSQETDRFRVVYYSPAHEYLAPLLIRSLENAASFDEKMFGYRPRGKITVLLQDFEDFGYGSAGSLPANFIQIGIAPFSLVYETLPSAERIGLMSDHELTHIVVGDQAGPRDRFFRTLFRGKILPNADDPLSIPYSFLASPRQYSPRWFHEGTATFMETWMGGGLGRALGGYDEMVFRALAREDRHIYDVVGLESEGTAADFQVGANSYLYGTRFMNYLALTYGPKKLVTWMTRGDSSRAYFASEFSRLYGESLHQGWKDWIAAERAHQKQNLALIDKDPLTQARPISPKILGSVSRAYFDPETGLIYAALRHTGKIPYLAAIHPDTGKIEELCEVSGGALYYVTSLAFDPAGRKLYFTTNNNGLRGLRSFDLKTRKIQNLGRKRAGDLVFNRKDNSLWGVVHANGLSTLIHLDPPYRKLKVIFSLPYGSDLFDLDISPDGTQLAGTWSDQSATQKLVRFHIADLLAGKTNFEILQDFQFNSPENFVFSDDGRYLYGSSYQTGVSNLFRFDLETRKLEALSNVETGLFRPFPLPGARLGAFEYTAQGFQLVSLPEKTVEDIEAIPYLGQSVVEKYPELKSWRLPPRTTINDEDLRTYGGLYRPLESIGLQSVYPIVQGYQTSPAGGLRVDFGDSLDLARVSTSFTYSPDDTLALRDRLHFAFDAHYWDWDVNGWFNKADFYDLFGPTKNARRGIALIGEKKQNLSFSASRRMDMRFRVSAYSSLTKLPDYQNVVAKHSKLVNERLTLESAHLEQTLGAIEDERGTLWRVNAQLEQTFPKVFMHAWGRYEYGMLTPLRNSSVWIRTSGGRVFGDPKDQFANFYFGGFGNNWVDKLDSSRYRETYAFPGTAINQLPANNFIRSTLEWDLPPKRFDQAGTTALYLNWARVALFTSGLASNLQNAHGYVDFGAQLDIRLVLFTYTKSTFSVGFAGARERAGHIGRETMVSLKLF